MSSERKIKLESSDGETFEVDEAVALESQTIKHMIEDDCADNGIPLHNVTSKTLAKVIEYCKKHVEVAKPKDRPATDEDLKLWDADFVKVDQGTLFDLGLAAAYLKIKSLLDLTCQKVASERKITLKSLDGETFEVDEVVAFESQIIKDMIEMIDDDCIPLHNVTSKILAKVIEYCKKHVEAAKPEDHPATDEDLKLWDADFVRVDQATLFDLILAANYLNIKSLLDLTCRGVAGMIKGKTPEEIRKAFNIKDDFTPEEEEEVRRENPWAFE